SHAIARRTTCRETRSRRAIPRMLSCSTKYARRILPIVSTVIIPAGPLYNQRRHLPLPESVNYWAPSPADPQAQPVNYSMPNYTQRSHLLAAELMHTGDAILETPHVDEAMGEVDASSVALRA